MNKIKYIYNKFRWKFHKIDIWRWIITSDMKRKLLGGNYDLKKDPECELPEKTKTSEFESAALDHLGGSIAFVRGGNLYEENEW